MRKCKKENVKRRSLQTILTPILVPFGKYKLKSEFVVGIQCCPKDEVNTDIDS